MLNFNASDLRLLINFFKIGLKDKFLGSSLGLIWAVVNPILMLGIFTFVFGFVFKSKLPGAETSLSYVVWLVSGYGPWLSISDGIANGTNAITGNAGLVRNLAFKTELLPLAQSLLGIVPLAVSLIYLIFLMVADGQAIDYHLIYCFPILLFQITIVFGIALILSALNVFIRDISLALPNLLLLLLFATPIFYPITSFPRIVQNVVMLNPFYLIAEGYRQSILYKSSISWIAYLYLFILSIVMFMLGLLFFRKYKGYFDSRV